MFNAISSGQPPNSAEKYLFHSSSSFVSNSKHCFSSRWAEGIPAMLFRRQGWSNITTHRYSKINSWSHYVTSLLSKSVQLTFFCLVSVGRFQTFKKHKYAASLLLGVHGLGLFIKTNTSLLLQNVKFKLVSGWDSRRFELTVFQLYHGVSA